jgi:hypothetical protein
MPDESQEQNRATEVVAKESLTAKVAEGDALDILDERLAVVSVEPNEDDKQDDAFPRNLHNAVELLVKTQRADAARRLHSCARAYFELAKESPDGNAAVCGRACICWNCGHCGLPKDGKPESGQAAVCAHCGLGTATNFLQATTHDGVALPWLEAKPAAALDGFDKRLFSVKVEPNGDEGNHKNFPKNVFNALELLTQVGHSSQAQRMQECCNAYLKTLDQGPHPDNAQGRGMVCFACGHCGLPRESQHKKCPACDEQDHTNWLSTELPNGMQCPWLVRRELVNAESTEKSSAKRSERIKPNEPCPCGSGKKSKKCCHIGGC